MHPSIGDIERALGQGVLRPSDLFSLRRELERPFRLHPLGFFACTLLTEGDRKLRLHYWPIEGGAPQSPECQIHDHRFEFRSWVLAGAVENIGYVVSAAGREFSLYQAEYVDNRSILIKTARSLQLFEVSRCTFSAGSSYVLPAGALHETARVGTEAALTVLITKDVSADAPLVLGPKNGLESYVYERAVLEDSIVEKMLASG